MKPHAFRLRRGDDLLSSLRAYACANGIRAAAIVSGVGCVTQAIIRDASGVTTHELFGRYEIVSITGTVSSARTLPSGASSATFTFRGRKALATMVNS